MKKKRWISQADFFEAPRNPRLRHPGNPEHDKAGELG